MESQQWTMALHCDPETADRQSHLFVKPFYPATKILNLFWVQIVAVIQGPVKILGQHVFIE